MLLWTRSEGWVTALFERRLEAFDNMDADALSRDDADDCTVDSPVAGALRSMISPAFWYNLDC